MFTPGRRVDFQGIGFRQQVIESIFFVSALPRTPIDEKPLVGVPAHPSVAFICILTSLASPTVNHFENQTVKPTLALKYLERAGVVSFWSVAVENKSFPFLAGASESKARFFTMNGRLMVVAVTVWATESDSILKGHTGTSDVRWA